MRGRHPETLALFPRLTSTAGLPYDLSVIVDDDAALYQKLKPHLGDLVRLTKYRQGYWKCLRDAARLTDGKFIVTLANDLLPGAFWLKRAMDAHQATFGDGEGLIGFNDGIHFGEHAAHWLINRSMLRRWYGDDYFPLCYDHNYGDVEVCIRAQEEGRLAIANFAVLFHNHYFVGQTKDDVYKEGEARNLDDRQIFFKRKAQQWNSDDLSSSV